MKTILPLLFFVSMSSFASGFLLENQMKNMLIQPYKSKKIFHFLDSIELKNHLHTFEKKNDFLCEAGTAHFMKYKDNMVVKFHAGCMDKTYQFKNVYLYFTPIEESGRETSYKFLGSRVQ